MHDLRRPRPAAATRLALAASLALGVAVPAAAGSRGAHGSATALPDMAAVQPDLRALPSPLPPHWQTGAFMEIFVRGYADSDGDGIGDLRGLTSRLDYLQSLGIKGLWLMPVTRSGDHDHGYAVDDYRRLEPAYGSLADFDTLIREAHRRGIGVIMDYVINHSARSNPLFRAGEHDRRSTLRDWYVRADTKPEGWSIFDHDPWTAGPDGAWFGQFGADMPDFNLRNPRVVAYHRDSLRFWLNRGLDGIRVDAVGHLFENGPQGWSLQKENYPFMGRLRREVGPYEGRYWVCESPGDAIGFADEDACGASFAFGHNNAIVQAAATGDAAAVRAVAGYFAHAPFGMATMVSNHDSFAGPRLMDAVGGDLARMKLAASAYLLEPGTPFIYYGEELGMRGSPVPEGAAEDGRIRGPVSWTADALNAGFSAPGVKPYRAVSVNAATFNAAAEAGDPQSPLAFYRAMLALRNTHPAIARGQWVNPTVQGQAFSVRRVLDGRPQLVQAWNYGGQPTRLTVSGLPVGAALKTLWPAGQTGTTAAPSSLPSPVVDAQGQVTLDAPALSTLVWELVEPADPDRPRSKR